MAATDPDQVVDPLVAKTAPDASPFVLPPGEGKRLPLLGLLKASGAGTANAFEVIEYEGPMQPPPHVHREREEVFYILDGTFTFVLGDDEFIAERGSLVFIPRRGNGRDCSAACQPLA